MNQKVEIKKVYVMVNATFDTEGKMTPQAIKMLDGRTFSIDHVTDVRRAASMPAGGVGIRYTCLIDGKEKFLFYENPGWFVEGRYKTKRRAN